MAEFAHTDYLAVATRSGADQVRSSKTFVAPPPPVAVAAIAPPPQIAIS
jgi:hypothetical protein